METDPSGVPGAHPPDPASDAGRDTSWWPALVAALLVIGCTATLLLTGHDLLDALLGASGMAVAGNEVARRILADAGPLPTIIATSAVAILTAVLIVRGYPVPEAMMASGIVGLVAGHISGRMLGATARP